MEDDLYYLTQEGYNQLKQELDQLKKVERPIIIEKVKEARSKGGGLEDNSEYESVREEQMMLEGRILEIEDILDNSKIVDVAEADTTKISVGSRVTVELEGEQEVYQIVGSAEADPGNGKISYESPVGKALLGLQPNDTVEVSLPHIKLAYRVLEIHKV